MTQEARAEKDNKIRNDVDAKSRNGDAEDDDDEDREGGDKVGSHSLGILCIFGYRCLYRADGVDGPQEMEIN